MADQRRNIKNKDSQLFKSLTRLFSGPLVNFRQQAQLRFRRRDLNKFNFNSASGKQFQKTSYNPFEAIQANILANQTRAERYSDFDQMEFSPELASALDLYSDEITTHSAISKMLQIKSSNQEIRGILESLYYDVLNIEFNLYGWARTMCKFGDMFLYMDIDPEMGVKSVIGLPSPEIERLEGQDKTNPSYVQFQWNSGGLTFESWQIAHFRILGQDKYAPYGTSVLEPARRIWRQLCVAKGEKILTIGGPKNIEDIKKGDVVFSWNPNTRKYIKTKVVAQKFMGKQNVFKLKTNHRSLSVTDNHKMLVFNGNSYLYKQAKDIIIGEDKLVLPLIDGGVDKYKIKLNEENYFVCLKNPQEYISKNIMQKIDSCECTYSSKNIHSFLNAKKRIPYNDYILLKEKFNICEENVEFYRKGSPKKSFINNSLSYEIDKEFARFFGFMLGDGWVENNKIGFATGVYENLNEYYKNALEKFSNCSASLTEPIPGKNGGQYNTFSIELKDVFESLGFISGAKNKEVPSWIYEMSLEARREFIQGYFDADGGKKDGRVTSISYKLLEGIQSLAQTCGIPCNEIKIDREDRTDANGTHHQKSFRMYLNMNKDSWSTDTVEEKVLSYSLYKENEDTYDIQVENELHNFIVNGVVSHNCLIEDAMMSYRIVRAPERRVFYIDVGNIAPDDVEQYMLRVQAQMKRNMIVDPQTGRVDLRYNPLSIDEDYYIPTRGQSATKIDTLAGGQYVGAIDDVQYLRDKLFTAIKIPQAYLTSGKDAIEDKTTLAQKDVRFARTIQRLQRVVVAELEKIGIIHLYTLGYRNEDLLNFSLSLNNPSRISELQELEHWKTKFDVASQAKEGFFSKRWIAENIFNLSEQDFRRIQRELYSDKQFEAMLEGAAAGAAGGEEAGGGAMPDLGGGEAPAAPETEAPEAPTEPEGPLPIGQLPPAKRRDNGYRPVAVDRRESKGRKHSMNSNAVPEGGMGVTARTMFPGYDNLKGLSKLSEGQSDDNEEKLHEVNSDIKNLLITLENMDADKNRKT